ncbi:MAG: hypothetical protein M3Z75_15800 [Actinomycetota bacterium]|nr:hypothetical protein [Actinomycetota bacterium]
MSGAVDMGGSAIDAATNVNSQLATVYPKKSRQELYAMQGITFLLGLLSIWAIQRDNGGCQGSVDSNSCSGISQGSWAFSHLVESFTS